MSSLRKTLVGATMAAALVGGAMTTPAVAGYAEDNGKNGGDHSKRYDDNHRDRHRDHDHDRDHKHDDKDYGDKKYYDHDHEHHWWYCGEHKKWHFYDADNWRSKRHHDAMKDEGEHSHQKGHDHDHKYGHKYGHKH